MSTRISASAPPWRPMYDHSLTTSSTTQWVSYSPNGAINPVTIPRDAATSIAATTASSSSVNNSKESLKETTTPDKATTDNKSSKSEKDAADVKPLASLSSTFANPPSLPGQQLQFFQVPASTPELQSLHTLQGLQALNGVPQSVPVLKDLSQITGVGVLESGTSSFVSASPTVSPSPTRLASPPHYDAVRAVGQHFQNLNMSSMPVVPRSGALLPAFPISPSQSPRLSPVYSPSSSPFSRGSQSPFLRDLDAYGYVHSHGQFYSQPLQGYSRGHRPRSGPRSGRSRGPSDGGIGLDYSRNGPLPINSYSNYLSVVQPHSASSSNSSTESPSPPHRYPLSHALPGHRNSTGTMFDQYPPHLSVPSDHYLKLPSSSSLSLSPGGDRPEHAARLVKEGSREREEREKADREAKERREAESRPSAALSRDNSKESRKRALLEAERISTSDLSVLPLSLVSTTGSMAMASVGNVSGNGSGSVSSTSTSSGNGSGGGNGKSGAIADSKPVSLPVSDSELPLPHIPPLSELPLSSSPRRHGRTISSGSTNVNNVNNVSSITTSAPTLSIITDVSASSGPGRHSPLPPISSPLPPPSPVSSILYSNTDPSTHLDRVYSGRLRPPSVPKPRRRSWHQSSSSGADAGPDSDLPPSRPMLRHQPYSQPPLRGEGDGDSYTHHFDRDRFEREREREKDREKRDRDRERSSTATSVYDMEHGRRTSASGAATGRLSPGLALDDHDYVRPPSPSSSAFDQRGGRYSNVSNANGSPRASSLASLSSLGLPSVSDTPLPLSKSKSKESHSHTHTHASSLGAPLAHSLPLSTSIANPAIAYMSPPSHSPPRNTMSPPTYTYDSTASPGSSTGNGGVGVNSTINGQSMQLQSTHNHMQKRRSGTCEWFDQKLGFGFIIPDDLSDPRTYNDNKRVFMHMSGIRVKPITVKKLDRVEYLLDVDYHHRVQAIDVVVTQSSNWIPPPGVPVMELIHQLGTAHPAHAIHLAQGTSIPPYPTNPGGGSNSTSTFSAYHEEANRRRAKAGRKSVGPTYAHAPYPYYHPPGIMAGGSGGESMHMSLSTDDRKLQDLERQLHIERERNRQERLERERERERDRELRLALEQEREIRNRLFPDSRIDLYQWERDRDRERERERDNHRDFEHEERSLDRDRLLSDNGSINGSLSDPVIDQKVDDHDSSLPKSWAAAAATSKTQDKAKADKPLVQQTLKQPPNPQFKKASTYPP